MRDPFSFPITAGQGKNIEFFISFLDWLKRWNDLPGNDKKLTKDTYKALFCTTTATIELSMCLLDNYDVKYALTGKYWN